MQNTVTIHAIEQGYTQDPDCPEVVYNVRTPTDDGLFPIVLYQSGELTCPPADNY